MSKTFYEILEDICYEFDDTITDTDTAFLAKLNQYKRFVNIAQEKVFEADLECLRKTDYITTKAKYTTGTLTATQDSATLTGAGTTWLRDMEGQLIVITDGTDGAQVYRLKDYSSATSFTLETPYIHTGGALLTYEIYYDTYVLPPDFKKLVVALNAEPLRSYYNDDYMLRSESNTANAPWQMKFAGVKSKAYYATGTVSGAVGATTITVSGATLDAAMVGRYVQLGNHGRLYKITAVTPSTSFTIDKAYGGIAALSSSNWQIEPAGLPLVRLYAAPSEREQIPFEYFPLPTRLEQNNDMSLLPSDHVLSLGVIWLVHRANGNPLAQTAKADFYEEIARLASREIDSEEITMPPYLEG